MPHSRSGRAASARALAANSSNCGGRDWRQKQRQGQGHTTINQQLAAIASEMAFVVAAVATGAAVAAAVAMAAVAATAVAKTVAAATAAREH